jgi:hypothetical protein
MKPHPSGLARLAIGVLGRAIKHEFNAGWHNIITFQPGKARIHFPLPDFQCRHSDVLQENYRLTLLVDDARQKQYPGKIDLTTDENIFCVIGIIGNKVGGIRGEGHIFSVR